MAMALFDTAGVCTERVPVYLDTADFSYLQDGLFPEEEEALRSFGRNGTVAYLLSMEHFLEVGGLDQGIADRVRFLQEFSGMYWIGVGSSELLKLEAAQFAAQVLGGDVPQARFPAGWFAHELEAEILQTITATQIARDALGLGVTAERASRAARGGSRRQREEEKRQTFLRRRDVAGLHEWMKRRGTARTGLRGRLQRLGFAVAERGLAFAETRGWLPAIDRSDPGFERAVANALPREVRYDRGKMKQLQEAWRDQSFRVRAAPALSCVAALEEATYRQTNADYTISTVIDRMHAAYVPFVDIFTSDKRNVGILRSVLDVCGADTEVVRTRRLADVVEAIKRFSE